MSELKHTPGPWVAKTSINGGRLIVGPGRTGAIAECFATVRSFNGRTDEVITNAALIAAAPELLEVALLFQSELELAMVMTGPLAEKIIDLTTQVNAAIAKAKA